LDGEPLLLASGSQDSTIRLWNIELVVSSNISKESEIGDDLLDAFEASLGDLAGGEGGGRQISLKRHIISVKDTHSRFGYIFILAFPS
jgi:elongator complex protein 2